MTDRKLNENLEEALVQLLDDPSPTVREALVQEFSRLEAGGVRILRDAIKAGPEATSLAAEAIYERVHGPNTTTEFIQFIQSMEYELETGMLLLNRVVQPGLDFTALNEQLDGLARRCRELEVLPSTPRSLCRIINRVLFHEHGFRGNIEDYEDPENSFLESVLQRRKGIPVSLCILYILVAQRLQLELEPIALPGHFLVGCFHEQMPFYIDPFERGRMRTVEEVRALVVSHGEEDDFQHLAPAPIAEVLCRVCRNLVHHFHVKNELQQSRIFARFVREFEDVYRRHSET